MKNIDGNRIIQFVIVAVVALAAAVTWTQLKALLYDEGGWLGSSIGFFILLVLLGMNWLLAESKAISAIAFVFILISFFFVFELRWEYFAVLAVALFLLFLGGVWALDEKNIRL